MKLQDALGEQNELALARLKRALIAQPGFQLIFLEVPEGLVREQVIEQVLGWSGSEEVPKLRRMKAGGRAAIVPKLASKDAGIVLDGIDSTLLDDETVDRFVGALNWQRDQLRKRIVGPLLLVVSARGIARLFERAPDLSTWRSHTCRISRLSNWPFSKHHIESIADSLDPDPIELAHAESILCRLTERESPADEVARAWNRVGLAHLRYGDLGQARNAFTQAEEVATPKGVERLQASTNLFGIDLEEGNCEVAAQRLGALKPRMLEDGNAPTKAVWLSLSSWLAAARGDKEARLTLARMALDELKDRPELEDQAKLTLASALLNEGKPEEALTLVEPLLEVEEATLRANAHLLAAKVEVERQRFDRAVFLLRRGMLSAKSDPQLRSKGVLMALELSVVLMTIGEWVAVRKLVKEWASEFQRAPVAVRAAAVLNDGLSALQLGRPNAVRLIEKACKLSRGSLQEPGALLYLSIARVMASDLEGARHAARSGEQLAKSKNLGGMLQWFQPYHEMLFPEELRDSTDQLTSQAATETKAPLEVARVRISAKRKRRSSAQ